MSGTGVRLERLTRSAAAVGLLLTDIAHAHPPADDFLNPHAPGQQLTLMPLIGPGFRAVYDRRFDIERNMSDVRLQVVGMVTVPFAEASVHIDARFFLMTFGASAGYHDEWHLLRFNPDPGTGRDRAGQPPGAEPPALSLPPGQNPLPPDRDPTTTFTDLDRDARAVKDAHADVETAHWPFFEARWGFLWPAYSFMGVSTLAARHDDRPDVSYDWENATVQSHGTSYRWENGRLLNPKTDFEPLTDANLR